MPRKRFLGTLRTVGLFGSFDYDRLHAAWKECFRNVASEFLALIFILPA